MHANTSTSTALKYHPDRNPGKEVEYNSKFQAIQSANEVLTDPQQRAKYDAQRIRNGHLQTYTTATPPPPRTSTSTRTPAAGSSNFPPPPRPPPPPQPKPTFASSQAGAQKYSNLRFNRAEPANPWSNNDDTKAKTNDYKAWEQMRARHGQGPIPSGRTAPPKPPRTTTFQPGGEPANVASAGATPRRSQWDRFRESPADIPNMTRSNTTRASPSRAKFAPRTPGGDEPQAQGSAYFKVSRDERSANSRSQMPPPPPTAKKPDPLQAFRDQVGLNEPFGKKTTRTSTQYQKGKSDGINFANAPGPGVHRSATSATPRDSNSRTGFYERDAGGAGTSHMRAESASSNHHSTSPPGTKSTRLPGMYSSSSSSASSSGDERSKKPAKVYPAPTNTWQTRVPTGEQPRRGFNLYANAGDERMANVGTGGYSGIRRHSAIDLNSDKPSEGFRQHRMKDDTDNSQQRFTDARTNTGSAASIGLQPSLSRSQSWQEKYGQEPREKWSGSTRQDGDVHSAEGGNSTKTPMYESLGYNPFSFPPSCGSPLSGTPNSDRWSDQWPFKSPKRPKAATAEPPPYWAIPSSLPPPQKTESRKRAKTHSNSRFDIEGVSFADNDPFRSFNIPQYTNKPSAVPPPIRSHSSDNIDTKFSPDGWHGKFFERPSSRTATPLRTVSPTEHAAKQQQHPSPMDEPPVNSIHTVPPPPHGQDKYHEERWVPHLNDIKFDVPQAPQATSPIRQGTRKRVMRARGPKVANAQPTVKDPDDEPTASSATGESLDSSKTSGDFDAMDIDQPTPPKNVDDNQSNGDNLPQMYPNGAVRPPRRVPTLPPRKNGYTQAHVDSRKLDLEDLKNVYPFAPSNEGLGNMNDIATNLPFESKASLVKPSTDVSLRNVDLPNPPVCPRAPSSLTDNSCDRFCRQVQNYMDEWTKFTVKMADLLATRRTFNQDNSAFTLLNIQDHGYDEYMKCLEESRRTRAHFDIAAEKHYKTMQDLGLWRQEVKRGRGGVAG